MRDGELDGMQHFDGEIEKLVRAGTISIKTGILYATNPATCACSCRPWVSSMRLRTATSRRSRTLFLLFFTHRPADYRSSGIDAQCFRGRFGTNARNRRGLSTMIWCSTSSLAPAAFSFGRNTVTVFA